MSAQGAWQNHFRSEKIEINYRSEECHDPANGIHKKLVMLQFVNLTGNALSVSFDKKMWYGTRCIGCDNSAEQHFTLTLNPGETITGTCADKRNKALYIVDKVPGAQSAPLTRFELANVTVFNIR